MTIQSFLDADAEEFFDTGLIPIKAGWATVWKVVARKLDMLDYAEELRDLLVPPGNRLEALKGSLDGQFSIRVNDRWRIVFRWTDSGPERVRVTDYHRG